MLRHATLLIVLLLATITPAAAQVSAPPPPPARSFAPSVPIPAGDSSIVGRVIDRDTKRPLAGALVLLAGINPRGQLMTQTDVDGAYSFDGVAAGDYRLSARSDGYVEDIYGAVQALTDLTKPLPMTIATSGLRIERATQKTIEFALVRAAAISGRVTGDDGRPLRGAVVSSRMEAFDSGYRFSSQWSARTNDRGEYVIASIPPGQYLVGATWNDPETAASTRARSIYHPGTDNAAEARLVTVAAGRTATGIDIKFPGTELLRIQGRVVTSTVAGPMEAFLIAGPSKQAIPIARDGTFSTPRLSVGRYTLVVRARDDDASEAASLSVDLTAELTDVVLGLMPTGVIAGHVVTDEGIPPPDTMQVAAVLADRGTEIDHLTRDRVDIGPDGRFEIRDVFGERILRVVGFTDGWTVDRVLLGKTPVTSLTFDAGATIDDVHIVLTRK